MWIERFVLGCGLALAAPVAIAQGAAGGGLAEAVAAYEGCAEIGRPLTREELLEIVPGHRHGGATGWFDIYGPVDPDTLAGLFAPGGNTDRDLLRYVIDGDAVCFPASADRKKGDCARYARCLSGEMSHLAWYTKPLPSAEIVAIDRVTESADAQALVYPSVSPKPEFAVPVSAEPPNVQFDDNEVSALREGLVGLYVEESDLGETVVGNYLVANAAMARDPRTDGGNWSYLSRVWIVREGLDDLIVVPTALFEGAWNEFFSPGADPDDKIEIDTLSPGVLEIVTNDAGVAGPAHWSGLDVRALRSNQGVAPEAYRGEMWVVSVALPGARPGSPLVLCTYPALSRLSDTSFRAGGPRCSRYDRVPEVTSVLGSDNALGVATALDGEGAPFFMRVGDVAVASGEITLTASEFRAKVIVARSADAASWRDPRRGLERPVRCRFSATVLERLAGLEVGDVLQFRAELIEASGRGIDLACRLP